MLLVLNINMSFLNIIKKILKSNTNIEEKVIEKLKPNELNNWIQTKKAATQEEESDLLKQIKKRILRLADELETETKTLQEITLGNIKAENRAKMIVGTNLDHYIDHLTNLITTLRELNITTTENLLENITTIFKDFEQKSIMNFQKASFLIGNKLSDIGVSTGVFFGDLRKIMKENESIINKSKTIFSINSKIKEMEEAEKIKLELNNGIEKINNKIKELETEKTSIEKEIEKTKKSKEYIKELKKKEEYENNKLELKTNITKLNNLIDFKLLANKFHSNPKYMTIIKDYKTNFSDAFQRDSKGKLQDLISEAKINNPSIRDILKQITKLTDNIQSSSFDVNKLDDLKLELGKTKLRIEDLNSEKQREQKKCDKFETNCEKILDSIKTELIKINVELE